MSSVPANAPLRPIGVLGGTFDPIHYGHLRLAEEAREALALERVLFIPAGDPPHRPAPGTPAAHRLGMVRCALRGHAAFRADDLELRRGGKSYTVTTLETLRRRYGPHRPLVLILGADAFFGLPSWHQWQRLFELAHLLVAMRPDFPPPWGSEPPEDDPPEPGAGLPPALQEVLAVRRAPKLAHLAETPAGLVGFFRNTPLAISATSIRRLLHEGRSARYHLPEAVLRYIATHSLYQGDSLIP